ncbi:hypothetical protein JN531_001345 [Flagellatimonas centrodinii]|uniref:hypothetical protein n=1 Tax=Flagellatimonas centrodinii TaxID=2806210 RepID=UPI001FEE9E1A|nr:hypothetical protein [Flagellatimonas centrodinii]ULQ46943.1 hypothetical protein JN531_001345 [Flagellatimonas centrodinii]
MNAYAPKDLARMLKPAQLNTFQAAQAQPGAPIQPAMPQQQPQGMQPMSGRSEYGNWMGQPIDQFGGGANDVARLAYQQMMGGDANVRNGRNLPTSQLAPMQQAAAQESQQAALAGRHPLLNRMQRG